MAPDCFRSQDLAIQRGAVRSVSAENLSGVEPSWKCLSVGNLVLLPGQVRNPFNLERRDDVTAHAEMVAFRRAGAELADADNLGGELRDATLYSTLQPCGMCTMASIWAKVGRILGRDATTFIGCILKSGISTHSISLPTRIATT